MLKYLKLSKNSLYIFLVSVGILTIFYQINFEDFWLDEMLSFWVADPELSWSETLQRHKKYDYHNPLFFNLVLKYFLDTFSYNPEIARYLPLVFGSLFLIIIRPITYQVKKDNTFLLTTLLACLSIYTIKYSQEVRPYSLLLLTSALNIFFFLKVLKKTNHNKKNIIFFCYFFYNQLFYKSIFSDYLFFTDFFYILQILFVQRKV